MEEKQTDWKKIKSEYIAGGTSYRRLAEKYGVSFSTLRGIAEREKWTELPYDEGIDEPAISLRYRAKNLINSPQTIYDPITKKYVTIYA